MVLVYKILPAPMWEKAVAEGVFTGAAIDLQDGYIHFSDGTQVEETAKLHFAGQDNLMLVAFDASRFGSAMKWEASRKGALFPHLYASLDPQLALWARPLPWEDGKNGQDGQHRFPEGWRA